MQLYYYSMKTGNYGVNMSKWILHDLKIPAYDPKEAVLIFYLHREYGMKLKNQWLMRKTSFEFPTKEFVFMTVRQVIEYELVKSRGFFLFQFKKKRIISAHVIADLFK